MTKILISIAVLLLSVVAVAQNENRKASQASFGRYGSDCSSGRGACSFTVSTDANSGRSSKKLSDKTITLEISRSQLTADEEIRIAGKPFAKFKSTETPIFIQSESIILDKTTLKNLDINPIFNAIQPGNYPMQITKDKVTIVFTLSSG